MKSNIFQRFAQWWTDYFKVALTAFRGMGRDNVMMISSGMVYSTLIALIPCLTFLVAFLSVFGVLQPFMDFITEFLVDVFGSDTGHQLALLASSALCHSSSQESFLSIRSMYRSIRYSTPGQAQER